jgi:hypothetical protein
MDMIGKLVRIAGKVLKLVLIELLVPGGTLVILALLLTGSSALAIPEKVVPILSFLKARRRLYQMVSGPLLVTRERARAADDH